MKPITVETAASTIKVHIGRMIVLAARQYPTLLASLLEIIQNAIDGNASHISVKLDRRNRTLRIYDNGNGASVERFNEALGQVGESSKSTDKLGRWGYGLVSPIDKCEVVTFTSCPKGCDDRYVQWTFRGAEIITQKDEVNIPRVLQPNIRFGKVAKTVTIDSKTISIVTWRTQMALKNYTNDREIGKIGTIDDLAKQIFDCYGPAMHTAGVMITLEFTNELGVTEVRKDLKAPKYSGERLSEHIDNNNGIRTFFRLYLAKADGRRGKSNGTVVVGESTNQFRFPFLELAKRCDDYIPAEISRALKSGIFEGEITSAAVALHENRKQFNINDGLVQFVDALKRWYHDVGAQYLDAVEDTRQGERYQQLGLESIRNIEAMFKTPRFAHLADLLKYLPHGTAGKQHSDAERVVGQQDKLSIGTQKSGTKGTSGDEAKKAPEKPPSTITDHHPLTVTGPKGQRRNVVDGGSFGLQFSYEKLPGEERMWIFDDAQGVLRFNVRHPTWVSCDTSDKRIKQLQELVAVQAVNWFFTEDNLKNNILRYLNDAIDQQAFMLVHSASFNSGAPKKIGEE